MPEENINDENYEVVDTSEGDADVALIETVDIIDVTDVEVFTIDVDAAFSALGEPNEELKHSLLTGRDLPDQHPVGAITGLRAELDQIEALKTVYSNKRFQADYYLWEDENVAQEVRDGIFVSLCEDVNKIKICTSKDEIYGVAVKEAAFVGAQADVQRDYRYGLVVYTGAVAIKCELDVEKGDFVTSNNYGVAQKSNSGYGVPVIAKQNINGITYAIVTLGMPIHQIDSLASSVGHLDARMDTAETNIISAMNVANEAYNKAAEAGTASNDASNKAQDALDTSNKVLDSVESLENAASQSQIVSAQAKAIAESAAVSAAAMCKEAIENANKAVADATQLRKEFDDLAINTNAGLEDAVEDLKDLKEDLKPLAMWPEDAGIEDATGFAGFVARADEDSSILGTMVGRKGEDGETLAGFIQEAEETRATVRGIVSYEYTDKDGNPVVGAAGLMAQVDDTQSEVSAIANRSFTKNDGTVVTGLAGLNAYVNENESNITLVSNRVSGEYIVIPELVIEDKRDISKVYSTYDNTTKATTYYYYTNQWNSVADWASVPNRNTSVIYYVSASKLYWYYDNNVWESTDDAYVAGLPSAIAGIQVVTDDNSSSINSLVSWQGETNTSMARIEQKADANGAYIQSTVANLDKYCVGPLSQAVGFTLDQAQSILTIGTIYVPTKTHSEATPRNREFSKQYYYTWDGEKWVTSASVAVAFSDNYVAGGSTIYWYIPGTNNVTNDGITYNSQTLYKWESNQWVGVATLAGSSQSRAVSQIRQDANSIIAEVTDARGDAASLGLRVTNTESNVQTLAKWATDADGNQYNLATIKQTADNAGASVAQVVESVGEDGKVTAASIVTAVNNSDSSVVINADHIRMEGLASFATKSDVEQVKESAVYDTKVEYALSSSLASFVAVTPWSTVAPAHQSGKYMWQRTTITKGDGSTATSNPTCIHGADGVSISSTTVTYGVSTSASTKPTSWQATLPAVPEGSYLWTCTVTDYTDTSMSDTVTYTYAKQGKTPVKGTDYVDGTSVTVKSIQYQAGTSPTTTPTGTWSSSVVSVSEGRYLWSKTTFSDGNVVYGVAKQGSSGKGVKQVDNYYLATNSSSGITANTSGWTPSVQSVSSSNKYLWNYEKITYTDNSTLSTDPCIIGSYGDDGKGISDVVEYYQVSTSNTTQPTTWVEKTPPALSVSNKYLWNYEKIVYTDNTNKTTTPCVIGVYGDTGATVTSEKKQFYLSTSNTSCTGGSWSDSPSGFTKGKYLWTRSVYTLSNGTTIYGAGVLDKTYTTISSWCSANNETLIDGANIATGTITANQIATNALQSNNYNSGTTDSLIPSGGYSTTGSFFDLSTGAIYAPHFHVDTNGDINANGGTIGGWNIMTNSLSYGGDTLSSATMFLSTGTTEELTIAEHKSTGWMLKAGSNFGVTISGNLYANKVDISGGTIANFAIDRYGMRAPSTGSVNIGLYANGRALIHNDATDTDKKDKTKWDGYLRLVAGSPTNHTALNGSTTSSALRYNEAGRFVVSSTGKVYCEDLNISNGSYLSNGNVLIACKSSNSTTPTCYGHIDANGMSVSTTEAIYSGGAGTEHYSVGFHLNKNNAGLGTPKTVLRVTARNSNHFAAGGTKDIITFTTAQGPASSYTDGKVILTLNETWRTQTPIDTISDRNKKHDIIDLSDKYSIFFDGLSPKLFKYNHGESGRYHMGLIAQEVEEALLDAGLTTQECAALCYSLDDEGNKIDYGIRYEELIALLIREVQLLKKKIGD